MKPKLTLSIPTPCSQQWGSFKQVEGGGFCSSCSKVVVDFTIMTDDQIIEYFLNSKGETCGRFLPGQLRTYSFGNAVKVNPGLMLLKAGLMSLLFFTVSRTANAQISPEKPKTELPGSYRLKSDSISFRGIVTSDEDRSPLPGVNVWLKGSVVGTTTDSDGRFDFPQPLKKGDVLVFSFIGLIPKEYKIDGRSDVGFDVPLKMCMNYDITGGVQVEGIYTEKKSGLWALLKTLF